MCVIGADTQVINVMLIDIFYVLNKGITSAISRKSSLSILISFCLYPITPRFPSSVHFVSIDADIGLILGLVRDGAMV